MNRWPERTLRERFDEKWTPEPFSGCWLWIGAVSGTGYGILRVDGRNKPAHRIAYALFRGEISDSLFCCHQCDTRLCANPWHLFLGTAKDNSQDAVSKGRMGGENSAHVLTAQQVGEIKRDYIPKVVTFKALAKRYGVDHTTIYKIIHAKRWKGVIAC